MESSWAFLTFRYTRKVFLQGIQFLYRTIAITHVREQTKETPHYLTEATFLGEGQGYLAVTNHYIAFLHQNKKTLKLFPLLCITDWGFETIDSRPVVWVEGSFDQGTDRFSWYVDQRKELVQVIRQQMEKGVVAKERAAIERNQAKLDSYMAIVNTILNDNSEAILFRAEVAMDDKADTLLQNTQVMLETMWEVFLTGAMPQLRALNQAEVQLLRDDIVYYAAIKGNRIAKIVLEARGYKLPAEDFFIDSDAFIVEFYKAVLPPFEILDKVHEDVLAIYQTFFPNSTLNQAQVLKIVSEAVNLGYRVTIANAMVIVKTSLRIAN